MGDLLNMDKLNALPQPLYINTSSRGEWWWPVELIDVETGCMRIDVMGRLDRLHFASVIRLKDADGVEHNTDDFYVEDPSHDH